MKELLIPVFYFLAQLGGFGLLLLGIMDSSFLFVPLGNDLLMLVLTAREPHRIALYALLAAAGSTCGSALVDWISRKGGEEGLQRLLPKKRIEAIQVRVRNNAGYALALGALMPPPFPFTAVVAVAAALQYPRRKLLTILAAARYLRFALIGLLGISFGRSVLDAAQHPAVQYSIIGLVVISVIGSVLSLYGWATRSRQPASAAERA